MPEVMLKSSFFSNFFRGYRTVLAASKESMTLPRSKLFFHAEFQRKSCFLLFSPEEIDIMDFTIHEQG